MSHKRITWQEISNLAARLAQPGQGEPDDIRELGQQLGKLGKVQFKANTLLEAQLEQHKETLSTLQAAVARQADMLAAASLHQQKEIESARRDLLLALLPVLDGLEAALTNGQQQLARLPSGGDAHTMLSGWLDGLNLVQRRMTDVLARCGVEPIPAVGQVFDPNLHLAAGVDTSGKAPAGTIVAEDLRGYRSPTEVLRYAEVIVSRPASPPPPADQPEPLPPQGEPEDRQVASRNLIAGRRFQVEGW
jgi:molecular chaperone GrpE